MPVKPKGPLPVVEEQKVLEENEQLKEHEDSFLKTDVSSLSTPPLESEQEE